MPPGSDVPMTVFHHEGPDIPFSQVQDMTNSTGFPLTWKSSPKREKYCSKSDCVQVYDRFRMKSRPDCRMAFAGDVSWFDSSLLGERVSGCVTVSVNKSVVKIQGFDSHLRV